MKKLKYFLLSLIFVLSLTTLSGCFEKTKYSISIQSVEHGIITTNTTESCYGEEITVTISEEYVGIYQPVSEGITFTKASEGVYSFTMPKQNVTISSEYINYRIFCSILLSSDKEKAHSCCGNYAFCCNSIYDTLWT